VATQVLALLAQQQTLLDSLIATSPTPFGPTILQSITQDTGAFGPIASATLVFGGTAAGPLSLHVGSVPAGAVVNGMYTFEYKNGQPDQITNFAPVAVSITGALVAISGGTETFWTASGEVVVNFQAAPAGMAQGGVYTLSYLPKASTGAQYDELVGTPTVVTAPAAAAAPASAPAAAASAA
jgi:hypothetical protein